MGKAGGFGQQPQARPKAERKKIKNRVTKSRFLGGKKKQLRKLKEEFKGGLWTSPFSLSILTERSVLFFSNNTQLLIGYKNFF